MGENKVLTIAREYGSKGRIIARELAARLGIPYYDKELIEMVSVENDVPYDILEATDEKKSDTWRLPVVDDINLERRLRYEPMDEFLYKEQAQIIRHLAEKESCIILGRCSNYILKDMPNCKSVYIHAPYEAKVSNVLEAMEMDRKSAQNLIKKIDKQRAYYYNYHTDQIWSDMNQYSLCLDSSKFTMEQMLVVLQGLYGAI